MAWVYILRGSSGRHYIGSVVDLDARLDSICAVTQRQQNDSEINLKLLRKKRYYSHEARKIERSLKRKKNPKLAIYDLQRERVEQPRKLSGLVGSSTLPLALPYSSGL